jgi:hypothetical protein
VLHNQQISTRALVRSKRLLIVLAPFMLVACSGESDTQTTTTTTSVTTTTTVPSMRGIRYCEVLLLKPIDGKPSAEVYNTYPLNECPDDLWITLDAASIAKEQGVPLAILNGPRYWLMDDVEAAYSQPDPPVSFGGMEMIKRATVNIGSIGAGEAPYTPHFVNRKSVFSYFAGSTVYQLVADDGSVYVMQSWSQQVDASLDETGLAALGERLELPAGWTFRTLTLSEDLDVVTTESDAIVLQDELKNSYSKIVAP